MPFRGKRYNSKEVKDGVRRKVRSSLNAGSEAAAEEMREVISSDTLTRASAERGGGRVETGAMLDAVQSTKTSITSSGKSYRTFFGWSTGDRHAHSDRMTAKNDQYKSYFDLQDKGFTHATGTRIVGMRAEEAGRRKFKEVMEQQWRN
jgi:hypothetical protein